MIKVLLSEDETKWYLLKADALSSIQNKDADRIRILRNEMSAIATINERIKMQFIDYLDYAMEVISNGFSEAAYQSIKKAVHRTMEEPLTLDYSKFRLPWHKNGE